jgi:hypothetical protein
MYLLFSYMTLVKAGGRGAEEAFLVSSLFSILCLLFPRLLGMDVCILLISAWVLSYVHTLLPSVQKEEKEKKNVEKGLFLLSCGLGAWILDGVYCRPCSPFQFHAAWHILTAAGVGFLWKAT